MIHHIPRSKEILSSPLLKTLNTQVLYLSKLNAIVAELLPALKTQCHVACYVNGVLTLQTHNQALLGQLRYLQIQYLQQLRQHKVFGNLIRIQFLFFRFRHCTCPVPFKTFCPVVAYNGH